jgi:hypothetical protein
MRRPCVPLSRNPSRLNPAGIGRGKQSRSHMDAWTKFISAGVGPIIVISACGLLCLAFYNRLAAVVTRLRAFHREQLQEQETLARLRRGAAEADELALVRHQEMVGMLEVQTQRVTRRAHLIRRTLACLLLTIALLAACSLAVGLSTVWPAAAYAAVPLFVLGLLLLIAGVVFALLELRYAVDPVEIESRFIRQLADDFTPGGESGGQGERGVRAIP